MILRFYSFNIEKLNKSLLHLICIYIFLVTIRNVSVALLVMRDLDNTNAIRVCIFWPQATLVCSSEDLIITKDPTIFYLR